MRLKQLASIFAMAALASGCVVHTGNVPQNQPERDEVVQTINPGQRYIVTEPLPVHSSMTQPGSFNSMMIFLADQLERNVERKSLANTFIVTSFANLDKLNETSSFGRLVAENLIHELQVRKWQVFDVRLTKDIVINEAGEFSLSRDIKKIRETYKVGGIVAGTYSVANTSLIVNARVIDIETGVVVSTGQFHIPINGFVESILFNKDTLKSMRIVGDANER